MARKHRQEPIRELDYGRGYVYCPSRGDGVAKVKDANGKERALATGSERVCVELCWYYTKIADHYHCVHRCGLSDWERAIPADAVTTCSSCGHTVLRIMSSVCPVCGASLIKMAEPEPEPEIPVVFWSPADLINDIDDDEEEFILWKVYGT